MLDFLKSITVSDAVDDAGKRAGGLRKERIPTEGLRIRVFRDGSVYPSPDLVSQFDLEYRNKPEEQEDDKVAKPQGYGFDVIDSMRFPTIKMPAGTRLIFISPAERSKGKTDLFAAVTYNTDGTPKSTVSNQGANTFGKTELLPLIKEVYGVEIPPKPEAKVVEGVPMPVPAVPDYIDLELVANPATNEPWGLPGERKIAHIPKKISRGDSAGEYNTVRRENPRFWALIPVSLLQPAANTADNQQDAVVTEEPAVADVQG